MNRPSVAAALVLCVMSGAPGQPAPAEEQAAYRAALAYLEDFNLPIAYQWLGDAIEEARDDDERAHARLVRVTFAGAEATASMLAYAHLLTLHRDASETGKSDCVRWGQQAQQRALELAPMIAADVEGLLGFQGGEIQFDIALDAAKLGAGRIVWDSDALDFDLPQSEEQMRRQVRLLVGACIGAALLSLTSESKEGAREAEDDWKQAIKAAADAGKPLEVGVSATMSAIMMYAGHLLAYLSELAEFARDPSLPRCVTLGIACCERVLALETNPYSKRRTAAEKRLRNLRNRYERARLLFPAETKPTTSAPAQ